WAASKIVETAGWGAEAMWGRTPHEHLSGGCGRHVTDGRPCRHGEPVLRKRQGRCWTPADGQSAGSWGQSLAVCRRVPLESAQQSGEDVYRRSGWCLLLPGPVPYHWL